MLERIMREIPKLTDAVVRAEVDGEPSYDIGKTGAADAAREVAGEVKQTARKAQTRGQEHCSAGAQGSRRRAGRGTDQGCGRLRGGSRDRAL